MLFSMEFTDMMVGSATKVGDQEAEVDEMLNQVADTLGIERTKDLEDTTGLPLPLSEKPVEETEDEQPIGAQV